MLSEPPAFLLKTGEVHVWFFNLSDKYHEDLAWERLLSAEETARSKQFIFDKDRLRFIARRGILRQLLGRYCNTDPAGITYSTNPYGKPTLSSHPLFFNLSSSQDRIAIACTMEGEIGVDIERVQPRNDISRLAEHWFSPEERGGLSALAPEVKAEAFYNIWTQKEAFIKARGEGLSRPLKDFSVSVDPDEPGRLLSFKGGTDEIRYWKMFWAIPEAGWRTAVCVRMENEPKILWTMAGATSLCGPGWKEISTNIG